MEFNHHRQTVYSGRYEFRIFVLPSRYRRTTAAYKVYLYGTILKCNKKTIYMYDISVIPVIKHNMVTGKHYIIIIQHQLLDVGF